VVNAVTAYAALDTFRKKGFVINENAIKRGFANVFWPGRFEIAQQSPPIILDCAHNRDSALKLRLTLEEYFPGKKSLLIFGASEDKDINGMLKELMPIVEEVMVVKSFHPRAIEQEKLLKLAKSYGQPVNIVEHIPEAIETALQRSSDRTVVVVTGSIFVVAEARKFLEKIAGIRSY
jgi:dihydrofolate synthase/folylpolyglutamate synthase